MILADTSVWVDYLRRGDRTLAELLSQDRICIHPMIIGELACGNLRHRAQLIGLWKNLPHVAEASHDEALFCLDSHHLMGSGIGFIDLHLLASALLTPGTLLWTHDRRLKLLAQSLGLAFGGH